LPGDKKIIIVSQSHLCRNPRVLKEAITLSQEGYKVTILTAIYSEQLFQEDIELINAIDVNYEFYSDLRQSIFSSFFARLVRKVAIELQLKLKIESVSSLGFNTNKLMDKCLSHKADLYIMHQELPVCVGIKLIKNERKVAFDMEDWYSEDLLPIARKLRPIGLLKKAEHGALHKGIYCTTTSEILADKLATVYSSKQPENIYNVFPAQVHLQKEKNTKHPLKLFWFSQTIGPGRGLEKFIELLNHIEIVIELHLLGSISGTYKSTLKKLMPKKHQLFFHVLVNEKELPNKIATFDIGLALELPSPPSRNYTITNKFFQYIQSGLPIIASETAGQNEGFDKFKPGFKLSQEPDKKEIEKLNAWFNNPAEIALAQKRAVEAAKYYCWENESKKLIKLVKKAFEDAG